MKKRNKFKVGDLVMMSAAGNNVQQNSHLMNGWGIIIEITEPSATTVPNYPIKAEWYSEKAEIGNVRARFKPYELKFFKKKS